MKRYDGILLCSDFDLTLTSDTYRYKEGDDFFSSIPKNNITAVNDFVANGGTFAVVSGRNPDEISDLKKVMDIADLCVCSNGTAVYSLSEQRPVLNKKFDKIVCVGDNQNDIGMVKFADIGYAVGNAIPALKEIASRVTVNSRDGAIAKIIEEL